MTKDEAGDPGDLGLWLDVNGARKQTGNTSKMIFDVATIVSYMSEFCQLEAGDLICTGTPPGVGAGMTPQQWLTPGDTVALGIDGLGEQKQTVVSMNVEGPFAEPGLFVVNETGELRMVDIANVPFFRPQLSSLAGGLRFMRGMTESFPANGTYAA